ALYRLHQGQADPGELGRDAPEIRQGHAGRISPRHPRNGKEARLRRPCGGGMKLKGELGLSELLAVATSAGLVAGTLYYLGFFHRLGTHFILTLTVYDLLIGVAVGLVSLAFGVAAGTAVRPIFKA